MPVKDPVLLYESSTESPTSLGTDAPTDQAQEQPERLFTHIQGEVFIQLPPPSPARFIKRSEGRLNASPSTRKETSCTTQHPLSTTHLTTSHDYGREPFLGINSSMKEPNSIVTIPRVSRLKNSGSSLPNSTNILDHQPPEQESVAQLIHPHNSANNVASLLYGYTFPLHKPVSAQTIFARNARALSLPKLDEHLALLSPPDFRAVVCDSSETMFPPMEQLAKAELSLEILGSNSTVTPVWRDRTLIFGGLLSYLLAILVCD